MTKTIAELYNGNLEPIMNVGKFNDEIKHLELLIENTYKNLENELSEKQKECLKKYQDNIDEYTCLLSEQAFCDGFCVGAKILAEVFHNAEYVM